MPTFIDPEDTNLIRQRILDKSFDSVQNRFPMEDDYVRIEMDDLHYPEKMDYDWAKQKKALMEGRRVRAPLKGTLRLYDKESNKVIDTTREQTLANVPYMTDRGTFIEGGNEYTIINQSRLRPGVYTRRQKTGDIEAQFNVKNGRGFRLYLEPSTGIFRVLIGQSRAPAYPLFKAAGVTDDQMRETWGDELFDVNRNKRDPNAVKKYYTHFLGYGAREDANDVEREVELKSALNSLEVDPEVIETTLGIKNAKTLNPRLLIAASGKMLRVNRGEQDEDDRDAPRNSRILGPENLISERVDKDLNKLSKKLLHKVKRKKSLKAFTPGSLDPYFNSIFIGSGLSTPLEETNPLHTLEQLHRITKLGAGGISSADAVTDEARDVNPGQFGLIDPVHSVEGCADAETEVFTETGWVPWPDVSKDTRFLCNLNEIPEFNNATKLIKYKYDGVLFGFETESISGLFSPNHRHWTDKGWETASSLFNKDLTVFTPYNGIGKIKASEHYKISYKGYIYCATVPGSLLYMRRHGKNGFWTGNSNIGVDVRTAYKTFRGDDGKLYGEVYDPVGKRKRMLDSETMSKSVIAFPYQLDQDSDQVIAMKDAKLQRVMKDEVDYEVPSYSHMFGPHMNMLPAIGGITAGRALFGSKAWSQYMPLKNPEIPLVDALLGDSAQTATEYYGRKFGSFNSPVDGVISKINEDGIIIKDEEGGNHRVELPRNFPFNRISAISFSPSVEAGQRIKKGDMVASSNFTDSKTGAVTLGVNLKAAYLPHPDSNYEDAFVVSQSAAEKLTTQRLFGFDAEAKNGVELGRNKFIALFNNKYDNEQYGKIGKKGVIKPGTHVKPGDPLILATGPKLLTSKDSNLGKLHKLLRSAHIDKSVVWENDYDGIVTDVAVTPSGARVNVAADVPLQPGDKISAREGNKGVVGRIYPDDEMPRDVVTNEPYEILLNPMGILSRGNPTLLTELGLSKIAKKTGKPIRISQRPPEEGYASWVTKQLKENGLSATSDLFDPGSGRVIRDVGDGYLYTAAFHHLGEKKLSARGSSAGYDVSEQPAKGGFGGAKRFSNLDFTAALSSGATEVIRDAYTVRGTKNEDFWKALRAGLPLPEPEVPFIYEKFLSTLRSAGANIKEQGDITSIMPMMDSDIDKLSGGEIKSSRMLDQKMEPIPGGLFDLGFTGGMDGSKFSHIKLIEPMPNPVMEDPIRFVLGLTRNKLNQIIIGKEELNGETGGRAIKKALASIDIDREIEELKSIVRTKRGNSRDAAVKSLGYLNAAKKMDIHPSNWMLEKVPVIPPKFRPISKIGDVALISDLNELYRDLIESNNNLKEMKDLVSDVSVERGDTYGALKATFGFGESITREGKARGLKGSLRQIIGRSPKTGMAQSKVFSKTVDSVGRGVAVPDRNLSMDEMGIPEDGAWELYSDFIIRRLVKKGYPQLRAREEVENRTELAMNNLLAEMDERPIILDRAPTWHKFNLMAFKPKLIQDKAVHYPALISAGFNLDSMLGEIFIINVEERGLVTKVIDISEFPRIENSGIVKENGTIIYDVPDNIMVPAIKDEKFGFYKVLKFSVHLDCEEWKVKTKLNRELTCSGDNTILVLDDETLTCRKIKTSESLNKPVPVLKNIQGADIKYLDGLKNEESSGMSEKVELNYNVGWFIGATIGDGWVDFKSEDIDTLNLAYDKDEIYNAWVSAARELVDDLNCSVVNFENGEGLSHRAVIKSSVLANWIADLIGDSGIDKQLPDKFMTMPEDFRQGILAGLLDTRGSLEWLIKKDVCENSQLDCLYMTVDEQLADEIKLLALSLGLNTSTQKSKAIGLISFQSLNMRNASWLRLRDTKKKKALKKLFDINESMGNGEILPLVESVREELLNGLGALIKIDGNPEAFDVYEMLEENIGFITRDLFNKILDLFKDKIEFSEYLNKWKNLCNDNSLSWDVVTYAKATGERKEMYDISVDEAWTFVSACGIALYDSDGDTVNFHVPVSDKAVEQAYDKMLASKNLLSLTDLETAIHQPRMEMTAGLYKLTQPRVDERVRKTFKNIRELEGAYRKGEIRATDVVEVLK